MGRGGNRFLEHWSDRRLDLPDGRRLTWTAMFGYDPPVAECFRLDGRPIAAADARRLLVAADHPDAELVRHGSGVGAGWLR
jgi:hypothetical protein